MQLSLVAYPRVHIALLDTAGRNSFGPGGLGFAVDVPPLRLSGKRAKETRLLGFGKLDQPAQDQANAVLATLLKLVPELSVEIELHESPPQHQGYGSKTLLLNGVVGLAKALAGLDLPAEQLQLLTGRGGTSGVGTHTFYRGGLIWDAGHRLDAGERAIPSSFVAPKQVPLLAGRWEPAGIAVLLVRVPGRQHSPSFERAIFETHGEVSAANLGVVLGAIFNGFLPAMLTCDFPAMSDALRTLHSHGFKKAELEAQSIEVQETYEDMLSTGMACGMSSMGPLLYVLVPVGRATASAARVSNLPHVEEVLVSSIRNAGASVRQDG